MVLLHYMSYSSPCSFKDPCHYHLGYFFFWGGVPVVALGVRVSYHVPMILMLKLLLMMMMTMMMIDVDFDDDDDDDHVDVVDDDDDDNDDQRCGSVLRLRANDGVEPYYC